MGSEDYHAEILADRRTLPTKEELASRRESRDKKENSRRRHYRIIWILVWIAAGLGVLCSVFLLGPLLRAVLALF